MQTSQDAFLRIKQKLGSFSQQNTSFFWSSAELPEIFSNNDEITLFPKEIFDQSQTLLEIVKTTINEYEEKENAFNSMLNCLVTMLLRQAQRIYGEKNKQQEKNRLVAVIVLLVILVNDSYAHSNSVVLGNFNQSVTFVLYNNLELYDNIIKSACECLKSVLLHDNNEEEEEKKSKSLLCICSVMLLHILQKIHQCKEDLTNIKPLRKKCVIFLIICGYAPSSLRKAALTLLSAPSKSRWSVTEKCDFYTTVSHLLLLVLQKYQQCPFNIFNEFNINFIPWITKYLQNVFFTNFLPFISSIACFLPTDQRFNLFSHLILSSKSKTNALIIKNKNVFQGAACMLCLAHYYNNLVMIDYVSKEKQWDSSVELFGLIVSKRWEEFDIRTITNQLKAFFLSLDHIIDTMDLNCDYEKQSDIDLIISRYQTVEKIMENLRTSKETFYCQILGEVDECIQEIHMNGWCWLLMKGIEKAKVSLRTGFLFHSWMAHTFLFLIQQNYKSTWKYVLTILKTLFKSIPKLSLIVYNGLKSSSRLYFLESFLRVTEGLTKHEETSQLQQLTLLTSQTLTLPFSRWHQEFRRCLFDTTFHQPVTHAVYAFRGYEEFRCKGIKVGCGEQDSMSCLDISNRCPSPKISSYINPLQNCLASCFEAFGVSSILNKSCLSLEKLYQVPMSSSYFSLESNAWIIVQMAHSVCRDTLVTFSQLIYPIIIQLKKKQQNSANSKLAKHEASHYHCLIDQLWSLLPRFVNEALDFLEVMTDPQNCFLNILLDNLKEPTTQKYICEALIIISKQIHEASNTNKSEKNNRLINPINNCKNEFLLQVWNIETSTCEEMQIFKTQIDQIMSKLVLYYLQNEETSCMEVTNIKEKKKLLYNALESLSNLCTKDLLEKNLHNFSRTWSTMVELSIGVVKGEVKHYNKNAISLTSSQCAALVDVCAALVHCLPDYCLYQLFHSFSKIVLDCSEGIQLTEILPKPQVEAKGVSSIIPAFTNDYKKSLNTLQYLLKSSYKGLDKAITCLTNSSHHEAFLRNLQPDAFMKLWKAIVECDASVLKIISWKLRSALFTSLLRLFCSLKDKWNDSLSSEETTLLLKSTIVSIVPQMLLSMSNTNKYVREKGLNVLHLIIENLCTAHAFMVYLLPGFASKNPTMRASTASAFVVFLRLWGTTIVNENLQKLFKIAMLLVHDKNKCVFRATLKLFRCLLRLLPKPILLNKFNEMMTAILASPYASANRLAIRFIIEKSISYLTFDELEKVFPTANLAFLQYVNREMKKRYEKKRRTSASVSSNHVNLQNKKEERDMTDSDASSELCYTSNDPINLFEKSQLMPFTAVPTDSKYESKSLVTKTSKKRAFENNLLSRAHKIQLIHDDKQKRGNKIFTLKKLNDDAKRVDNDGIRIDENGKIVIEDVSNTLEGNTLSCKLKNALSIKSKKNDLNYQKDQPKQHHTGLSKNRLRIKKGHLVVKSSKNFSSKKGLGDVTRSVGVAPYSYIRLNPKIAKEKHRSSVIKAFKSELRLKKRKHINSL